MRFQLAAARLAFAALCLAVLTAAAAVVGVRLGALPDASGSFLMIPATALGVAAMVAALLWLRAALRSNLGTGKRLGLIALIGSLLFLYQPLSYVYAGFVSLPIHDATTDPEDPPQFVALAKIPSANARAFDGKRHIRYKGEDVTVAYALHDKYYLLTKPHKGLLVLPAKAYWRAYGVVERLGWTIVDASEKDLRIEATSKSFWFGRVSDIVIQVRQAGTIGSWVDVRSESREAGDDHGRNVARLKEFFAYFKL
ncbi:MAG TPA: DUF1499 domain-containing protein [Rhizomicrobium sp.]|jgi:hypothetical protein